jgi:cobalt/nickel transport system permease protein
MSLQLDTLAYTNQLRQLPPEHKLVFAIAVLIIALFAHPPVQVAIAVWMSIWTVVYAKIPTGTYWRLLVVPTLFWLTSLPALLINIVSVAELSVIQTDALHGLNVGSYYLYLSRSGCEQALVIFTRMLASVSCLYFVMLTVPFAALLQIMRQVGFPVILTELLLLMYRFIFILLSTAAELWTAQQSRVGYRTWRTAMHSLSLLIGQLFRRTIENYHQFSLVLAARGFTGDLRVWHSRRYRASKRYILEALLGCVVLLGLEGWTYKVHS